VVENDYEEPTSLVGYTNAQNNALRTICTKDKTTMYI